MCEFSFIKRWLVWRRQKAGENEFLQIERDEEVIHTYYDINEAEAHFENMKILYKEDRVIERIFEGEKVKQGYIDYIVQKFRTGQIVSACGERIKQ